MWCFEISESRRTWQTASNCLSATFCDKTSCARAVFGNTVIPPIYLAQHNSQQPTVPVQNCSCCQQPVTQTWLWQNGAVSLPHPGSNPLDNSGLHRKRCETEILKVNDSNNLPFVKAPAAFLRQVCTLKPKGGWRVLGWVVEKSLLSIRTAQVQGGCAPSTGGWPRQTDFCLPSWFVSQRKGKADPSKWDNAL